MSWLHGLRERLRGALGAAAAERELDEEIRHHLALEAERQRERGMSDSQARRTALARFGDPGRIRQATRDERGTPLLDGTMHDLRLAVRSLRRQPGLCALAALTIALGIGATTAVYSVVSSVLLRPLPFHDPERLGAMYIQPTADSESRLPTFESVERVAAANPFIEGMATFAPSNAALTSSPEPEQLVVEQVTAGMFTLLGVPPMLGRTFVAEEHTPPARVVVLSHDLWRRQFDGDSAVVERTIVLDGIPHTVIGVMPPGYRGARLRGPGIWLPLDPAVSRQRNHLAIVRWRATADERDVERWIDESGLLRPLGRSADSTRVRADLVPLATLLTDGYQEPLFVLLGAVGIVLVLVGANAATLLLARAAARQRELAVCRALGATRWRQVRQLLAESAVLAGTGGSLGVLGAYWIVGSYGPNAAGLVPRATEIAVDWRVLAVAIAITGGMAIAAGLVPALLASSVRLTESFRNAASGNARVRWGGVRSALVVIQVALSVSLLVAAGLAIKSFLTILPDQPGFETRNRLAVSIRLDRRPAYDSGGAPRHRSFVDEAQRRLRDVPGVEDVAAISYMPLVMVSGIIEVDPPDRSRATTPTLEAHHRSVTPNYFDVMRIPVLRGRAFTDADVAGAARVAIVNATTAHRWWGNANPVGQTLTFTERGLPATTTVVGVSGDVRFSGASTRVPSEVYVPFAQAPTARVTLLARTSDDPRALATLARRAIWAVDPALPVDRVQPVEDIVDASVSTPRFYSTLMAGFAAVALVLAVSGIFGVLAFTVSRRRREIGIRLALGAPGARVRLLVVRQGMAIALGGLAIGALMARPLVKVVGSILYEVSPTDPWVFGGALALIAVAALVACLVPAQRAARVDPIEALRSE